MLLVTKLNSSCDVSITLDRATCGTPLQVAVAVGGTGLDNILLGLIVAVVLSQAV